MRKLSEVLTEGFVNLFTEIEKQQYVDQVWDIIVAAYASQGGIRGFETKSDMINMIQMWKLVKSGNTIVAVALYKDKGGRKLVALGTDGSELGKSKILEILVQDIKTGRAYAELSGKALRFISRAIKDLTKYAVPVSSVKKKFSNKVLLPVQDDDPEINMFPELKDFFYRRDLSGHLHTKVLLGDINAPGITA